MTIRERVAAVESSIAEACRKAGRDRSEVILIAVSKTQPPIAVSEAVAAGIVDIGENKVQEAGGKVAAVHGEPRWHLIGHLQSNKTRKAAAIFDWVQTIDSEKVARRLSEHGAEQEKVINVMIQVNIGSEPQKAGVLPEDLGKLADEILEMSSIRLRGLMTIPPVGTPEESRRWFGAMRECRDALQSMAGKDASQLSMGMSEDFEEAIAEGATMVRVGRAIFGERN